MMLAHYHGQIWNASEIAGALQIKDAAARRYLDVLEGVFMMRQLPPWHENISKRQVKSPKVYFRDSGLLHALLGIRTELELATHPKVGASWEGYVVEEVLRVVQPDQAYFWATHGGAELDLLLFKDGQRIGVECKRVDAPRLTPSMRSALDALKLDRLFVVYPGALRFPAGGASGGGAAARIGHLGLKGQRARDGRRTSARRRSHLPPAAHPMPLRRWPPLVHGHAVRRVAARVRHTWASASHRLRVTPLTAASTLHHLTGYG